MLKRPPVQRYAAVALTERKSTLHSLPALSDSEHDQLPVTLQLIRTANGIDTTFVPVFVPPDPTKLTHDDPLEKERCRRVLEHANKAFPDGFPDPFSIDKTRFVSGSRR